MLSPADVQHPCEIRSIANSRNSLSRVMSEEFGILEVGVAVLVGFAIHSSEPAGSVDLDPLVPFGTRCLFELADPGPEGALPLLRVDHHHHPLRPREGGLPRGADVVPVDL